MLIGNNDKLHKIFAAGYSLYHEGLPHEVMSRVEASYHMLLDMLETKQEKIYGLHTHYGFNVNQQTEAQAWQEHQSALLNYLKVGKGKALSSSIVRRALKLQVFKCSQGLSGIHPDTLLALHRLSNESNLPRVPAYGSLGASGDLIPMAHAVSPIFQENGPKGPRDVIGLVNTNSMMSSYATESFHRVLSFYQNSLVICLQNAMALGWKDYGLQNIAWNGRSRIRSFREAWIREVNRLQFGLNLKFPELQSPVELPVQERYSIRCAPQIFWDIGENLQYAESKIVEEALGVADNPIIIENQAFHGGHFYTASLATACDLMNDALTRMCDLLDRQTLLLVGSDTNHGLPANLQIHSRDHVKGIHQLISAFYQRVKSFQTPARALSFSCESNNQDVVPASMSALLQLDDLLEVAEDLVSASAFISERGLLLRTGRDIPERLRLDQFENYTIPDDWPKPFDLWFDPN